MKRHPHLFGLHAKPGRRLAWLLALIPFLLLMLAYGVASHQRHQDNPADKVLPSAGQMLDAAQRMAFGVDARSGKRLLWADTAASLRRLLIGLGLAALVGLLLGLNIGLFPGLSAAGMPFVTFLSMVPPLAVLPILFISLGVDELSKIALIFIGIVPVITRDIAAQVSQMPREQITKALTLGATPLRLAYGIVLPQLWPRLIASLRLSLGAAWLFLIAAEAIAADSGLGYRVFLMRRYLAMDVILPYVLWITLLGFAMDLALRGVTRWRFPWYPALRA
ncbi:ABC transporter permease [Hydrocarboniphaga sp.]|uniref:ABC transporter permease n=1 Tax=Hydrocarboniphaga sp. TaxID=2033016 RepID=UPI003D115A12